MQPRGLPICRKRVVAATTDARAGRLRRVPSEAVLDPRIYRNGMIIAALAVIVVAFSLGTQPDPLGATLVPDAFNGSGAYATMSSLATRYPARTPGSHGDNHVADYVARALRGDGA